MVVRESTSITDPDGEVKLTIERIQGSEGNVNVQWRLNAEAVYDFYEPHTGTLKFAQVSLYTFALRSEVMYTFILIKKSSNTILRQILFYLCLCLHI